MDLSFASSRDTCDDIIRIFDSLRFLQEFLCDILTAQTVFHTNQDLELIDEPEINLCNLMDSLLRESSSQRFRDNIDSTVIYDCELIIEFIIGKIGKAVAHEAVCMLLKGTDCLHQGTLEVIGNGHDFAGSLHLSGQCSLCSDELIERQSGNLNYNIVKHRLETCIGLPGNCILDLIQVVSKGNLRCNLSDGITSRLRCQCRGSGYTRVHFDNAVLEGIRIQRILNVTSTSDTKLRDDIQSRAAKHLVFLIT